MLSVNPFAILAETVSPIYMQSICYCNASIDCCWNPFRYYS